MSYRTKEWMKFLAGASAGSAVVEFALGRSTALPVRLGGVTITPAFNGLLVCVSATLAAHLAYYAWRKETPPSDKPGGGSLTCGPRHPPSRLRSFR